MMARVFPVGIALLALAGCVSDDKKLTTVSPSPFSDPGRARSTQAMHPPSTPTEKDAVRVATLGRKILAANPQLSRTIVFVPIGDPNHVEIFHRFQRDSADVILTEGLIQQCKTDAELAAVLCRELGKIASEQTAMNRPLRGRLEPPPLITPTVGNDIVGTFGPPDGTRMAELAILEKDRGPAARSLPPPAPEDLARIYLQKAGFHAKDLDAVAPLLRCADQNSTWEQQMTGKLLGR